MSHAYGGSNGRLDTATVRMSSIRDPPEEPERCLRQQLTDAVVELRWAGIGVSRDVAAAPESGILSQSVSFLPDGRDTTARSSCIRPAVIRLAVADIP